MICYFIDHLSNNKKEQDLAELSLSHKISKFLDDKNSISLITCHRIEYYTDENSIDNKSLENLFKNFKKISNPAEVYLRLFKIALGLESQIIGENSIFKQTSQSIQAYLYNNPQEKVWMDILSNAKKTRDLFQFWSKNHGQLIFDHIKKSEAKTIIFFGAGSLNQSIISSLDFNTEYESTILVTRNIKKAKKCFSSRNTHINIVAIENINENLLAKPYDIFIATDRLDNASKKIIASLCEKKECLNVVDVSSSPIPEIEKMTKNYFSMYSKNTSELVKENNIKLEEKKVRLLNYLNSMDNNWYIH